MSIVRPARHGVRLQRDTVVGVSLLMTMVQLRPIGYDRSSTGLTVGGTTMYMFCIRIEEEIPDTGSMAKG